MKPRVFVLAVLGLLTLGVVVALTSGPPAVEVSRQASNREVFAAMLGLAVLAFVAMGWDGSIER